MDDISIRCGLGGHRNIHAMRPPYPCTCSLQRYKALTVLLFKTKTLSLLRNKTLFLFGSKTLFLFGNRTVFLFRN